jgi:hypothetical protein
MKCREWTDIAGNIRAEQMSCLFPDLVNTFCPFRGKQQLSLLCLFFLVQGCQMAYFQTRNRNLRKFWRVLQWKMLVFFMAFGLILRLFSIFYAHLVYLVVIWYILPRFGMFYQEKYGNHVLLVSKLKRCFFQTRATKFHSNFDVFAFELI